MLSTLRDSFIYNRIILATDSSDTSERAFQEALRLAKYMNGTLRIIHVFDAASYWAPAPLGITAKSVNALYQKSQDLLDKAAEVARDTEVETQVRLLEGETSRIAQIISDEADEWAADLIVAGTHGRHGPSRLVLGSVAENIARISNKPLLLVRSL